MQPFKFVNWWILLKFLALFFFDVTNRLLIKKQKKNCGIHFQFLQNKNKKKVMIFIFRQKRAIIKWFLHKFQVSQTGYPLVYRLRYVAVNISVIGSTAKFPPCSQDFRNPFFSFSHFLDNLPSGFWGQSTRFVKHSAV